VPFDNGVYEVFPNSFDTRGLDVSIPRAVAPALLSWPKALFYVSPAVLFNS
jgi:hypothetical protein